MRLAALASPRSTETCEPARGLLRPNLPSRVLDEDVLQRWLVKRNRGYGDPTFRFHGRLLTPNALWKDSLKPRITVTASLKLS